MGLDEADVRRAYNTLRQSGTPGVVLDGVRKVVSALGVHMGQPDAASLVSVPPGEEGRVIGEDEFAAIVLPAVNSLGCEWADVVKVVGEPRSRSSSRSSRRSRAGSVRSRATAQNAASASAPQAQSEEGGGMRAIFATVDIDGSNSITKNEFREMLRVLQPKATDQEILTHFMQADLDKSQEIDGDEFVRFMEQQGTHSLGINLATAAPILREFYAEKKRQHLQTMRSFRNTPPTPEGPDLTAQVPGLMIPDAPAPGMASPDQGFAEKSLERSIGATLPVGASRPAPAPAPTPEASVNEAPTPTSAPAPPVPPMDIDKTVRGLPPLHIPEPEPRTASIDKTGAMKHEPAPLVPPPSSTLAALEVEYCAMQEEVRRGAIVSAELHARRRIDFGQWEAMGSPRGVSVQQQQQHQQAGLSRIIPQLDVRVAEGQGRRFVASAEQLQRDEMLTRMRAERACFEELRVMYSVAAPTIWHPPQHSVRTYRTKRWGGGADAGVLRFSVESSPVSVGAPPTEAHAGPRHSRQLSPPPLPRRDPVGVFPPAQLVGSPSVVRSPVASVSPLPASHAGAGLRVHCSPYAPSPEAWQNITPPAALAAHRLSPPRRQVVPPTIPLMGTNLSPRVVQVVTNAVQPYATRRHQRW